MAADFMAASSTVAGGMVAGGMDMAGPAVGVGEAPLLAQGDQFIQAAGPLLLLAATGGELLLAEFLQFASDGDQLLALGPKQVAAFRAGTDGAGHGGKTVGAGFDRYGFGLLAFGRPSKAPGLGIEVMAEPLDVADVIKDHRFFAGLGPKAWASPLSVDKSLRATP